MSTPRRFFLNPWWEGGNQTARMIRCTILLALGTALTACEGSDVDAFDGGHHDGLGVDAGRIADAAGRPDVAARVDASGLADGGPRRQPVEVVRTLVILATHNGVAPTLTEADVLEQMRVPEAYFRRSSCDAVGHAGIERPDQLADVWSVDLGDLGEGCSDLDIRSAVSERIRERRGDDGLRDYDSVGILIGRSGPTCAIGNCNASRAIFPSYLCRAVNTHEMGHLLGLDHAGRYIDEACHARDESSLLSGCGFLEYGDGLDVMGGHSEVGMERTLNAPHLAGMGWLQGRIETVSPGGGRFCLHPFDPPPSVRGEFCDGHDRLTVVEQPIDDYRVYQIAYRAQAESNLRRVEITLSRAGGSTFQTRLAASLYEPGAVYTHAAYGFEVVRRETCEGDGVEVEVRTPQIFVRGDVDGDGDVDESDRDALSEHLANGGAIGCQDAADVDDSGRIGPEDLDALRAHLERGEEIPPPGVSCGYDAGRDSLECASGSATCS